MNVLNARAAGFDAGLGHHHDTGGTTAAATAEARTFSKWMDNASGQQQAAQTQKPSPSSGDMVGERHARQSETRQQAQRAKATGGSRDAAETERSQENTSAEQASEHDDDARDDHTVQDMSWPPPGLAALLSPTTTQATRIDGELPQDELPGAGKGASATMLSALMAQSKDAKPAAAPPALLEGDARAGALTLNALPMAAKPEALPADMAALVATLSADTKAATQIADRGADTSISDVRAAISLAQPAPLAAARDVAVVAPPSVMPNLQGDAFPEEVGAHLKWMAEQKVGHAHLRISPDDMGTVDIRLKLDGDRVTADFNATQADVRQALEQSLPRLRDLLGQHGFQLAQADVGQQSRQDGDNTARTATPAGVAELPDADATATVSVASLRNRGLLDAYA